MANDMPVLAFEFDAGDISSMQPSALCSSLQLIPLDELMGADIQSRGYAPKAANGFENACGHDSLPGDGDSDPITLVEHKAEASLARESSPKMAADDKSQRPIQKRKASRARTSATTVAKPRKSARKARRGYKAFTKEEAEDVEGELKRERFLEQNRVAANKCREKKKRWTSDLESRARELGAVNAKLKACAFALKQQMQCLKSECLDHTDCACDGIRQYLGRSIAGMSPSGLLGLIAPTGRLEQRQQWRCGSSAGAGVGSVSSMATSVTTDAAAFPDRDVEEQSTLQKPASVFESDMIALLEASIAMLPDGDVAEQTALAL